MLLTPGLRIARAGSAERIAVLTRTATSIRTPHHGTPLANHFVSVQGQTLLLVLSELATSGQGRRAILAAAKAVALVARLDERLGRKEGPLDRIAEGVLRRIRYDRRDPAWKYLGAIRQDQGAVLQLTPEGIEMFDAAVADRTGIEYGCVVAGVPEPCRCLRVHGERTAGRVRSALRVRCPGPDAGGRAARSEGCGDRAAALVAGAATSTAASAAQLFRAVRLGGIQLRRTCGAGKRSRLCRGGSRDRSAQCADAAGLHVPGRRVAAGGVASAAGSAACADVWEVGNGDWGT
jgi:hypothetical protein